MRSFTRVAALIFLVAGAGTPIGHAATSVLSVPLFCLDLFATPAETDRRLFEAYVRALAEYRTVVGEERFQAAATELLEKNSYYLLPQPDPSTGALTDLVRKIGEARKGSVDFDWKARDYLETEIGLVKSIRRSVETAVENTRGIRNPFRLIFENVNPNGGSFPTIVSTSPDFREAIFWTRTGLAKWDLQSAKKVFEVGGPSFSPPEATIGPDFKQMLVRDQEGTYSLYDLGNGDRVWSFSHPKNKDKNAYPGDFGVSFRVNSEVTKIFESFKGKLVYRDFKSAKPIYSIPGPGPSVTLVKTSPDFRRALLVDEKRYFYVWDIEKRSVEFRGGPLRAMDALDVDAELTTAVARTNDITIRTRIWNLRTGTNPLLLEGKEVGTAYSFGESGTRTYASLVSGISIWDTETGNRLKLLKLPAGLKMDYHAPVVNEALNRMVTTHGNTVLVWDIEKGKIVHRFVTTAQNELKVRVSADFARAIASSFDGVYQVWDLRTGAVLSDVKTPFRLMDTATSPDLSKALTISDGRALLWEVDFTAAQ